MIIFGPGKLIDLSKQAHAFISPHRRAQATSELFDAVGRDSLIERSKVTTTDELAEWDYGKY